MIICFIFIFFVPRFDARRWKPETDAPLPILPSPRIDLFFFSLFGFLWNLVLGPWVIRQRSYFACIASSNCNFHEFPFIFHNSSPAISFRANHSMSRDLCKCFPFEICLLRQSSRKCQWNSENLCCQRGDGEFSLSLLNKFPERTMKPWKNFSDEQSSSEFLNFGARSCCYVRWGLCYVYIKYIFKALMYTKCSSHYCSALWQFFWPWSVYSRVVSFLV